MHEPGTLHGSGDKAASCSLREGHVAGAWGCGGGLGCNVADLLGRAGGAGQGPA